MKDFSSLNLGFLDAENYLGRDNKAFFSNIFFKDDNLDKLLSSSTYFLIGEKGTGKTAYSVFLTNNEYKNTRSEIKYIRETDYAKFIELKKQKNLDLSGFSNIWKVILLVLVAKQIEESDLKTNFIDRKSKIQHLVDIIDDYYEYAFSPEIINVLHIVESDELMAKMNINKNEVGGKIGVTTSSERKSFNIELIKLERSFEDALKALKLKKNIILFIDGIDMRPGNIEYQDYIKCIKGLSDATWALNRDLFGSIRDSLGRIKIVLLLRPDIFNALDLPNDANKLRDNSVFLDWRTTYPNYRTSQIFKLIDRLLSIQQENMIEEGKSWDEYFPWKTPTTNMDREYDESFISFLRLSYFRPRDIIASLQFLQDKDKSDSIFKNNSVDKYIQSPEFKDKISEYILRSIKNQTSFYYTDDEYNILIIFFDYLYNPEFTWDEYCHKFDEYIKRLKNLNYDIPEFAISKEKFLQFLYDTNIICYMEYSDDMTMFRWCYRERNFSRIAPKVKFNVRYKVHNGLYKALNIGHKRIFS